MQERRKALLGELDRTGEDHLSLTDPNVRVMVVRSAQYPTPCPSRSAACRSRGLIDQAYVSCAATVRNYRRGREARIVAMAYWLSHAWHIDRKMLDCLIIEDCPC